MTREILCINSDKHGGVVSERDTEPAGEALPKKPTRKVCSSASYRNIYGGRWRDLIGQLECRLEILIGWEPQARAQAHMNGLSRMFYYEDADACAP